jgi:crossover junction endodeoxyribonuclease RusA
MTELYLKVPFPPSMNSYWRNIVIKGRPRTLLSEKGRQYRIQIMSQIHLEHPPALSGRLHLTIELYPPDRRKRDLDNHCKAIQDGLAHAGVFEDDSQIDQLTVIRREVEGKPGHAMLTITEV